MPKLSLWIVTLVLEAALPALGSVTVESNRSTVIRVAVPGQCRLETTRLPNPERLVVDCHSPNAMQQPFATAAVRDARVQQVRVAVFKADTIRMVVDLNPAAAAAKYMVTQSGAAEVRIEIPGLETPAKPEPAPTPAPALKPAPAHKERVVTADPVVVPDPPAPSEPEPVKPQTWKAESPRTEPDPTPQAQPQSRPAPAVKKSVLPPRVGIVSESPLTLNDALVMAIANNPEVLSLRVDGQQAGYRISGARGVYDPVLTLGGSFQKQVTPVSSSLAGSNTGAVTNRAWQISPSLLGSFARGGGSYEVTYFGQRFSTDNSFATLNPNYPSGLSLQLTQPLWRGLRYDLKRHNIEIARRNREVTAEQFRRRVMDLIRRTESAYWEVVYARREVSVQAEALDIARAQEEINHRLVGLGQMAAIDETAAQTQVANFEINLFAAQDALTRAENQLKSLVLGNRTAALWSAAIQPVTPLETNPAAIAEAEAVTEAISQRPELQELKVRGELNLAEQKLSKEQLKPQLDLNGRYTLNGLGGTDVSSRTANPLGDSLGPALIRLNQLSAVAGLAPITLAPSAAMPANLVGGFGTSTSRLFGADFPTYLLELRLTLPLRNRTAEANLAVALAEAKRLEHQKQAIEVEIEAEVRNALQAIASAKQRLQAARNKQRTAEAQYESEERRFREGASTLFLVEERRLSMVVARSQVHRAEVDLNQALSAFQHAHGDNYRRYNIAIQ